jgi:type III restriction enzyme
LELDKTNESVEVDMTEVEKAYKFMKETLEAQGMGNMVMSYDSFKSGKEYSSVVKSKNNSFHYLPYNFGGSGSSGFEIETLAKSFAISRFQN